MQKSDDAIYDIGLDRGRMKVLCVKCQQHANNLRRTNDINVAEIIYKLVNQQSTPEIEKNVFGGKQLEFHYFLPVFNEAIKKKIEDPCGKLTQLTKYTTGEKKEMVKNCIELPPKKRCKTAKQMMHQLYGNPHRVIALYHKETKKWPQIRPGDGEAYRRFAKLIVNDPVISEVTVEQYICM